MFKSATLSTFLSPKISSKTKTQPTIVTKSSPVTWAGTRPKAKTSYSLSGKAVPMASIALIVAVGGILAMHLFWVNTYSSKGLTLKQIQTSIKDQTETQKKLLVRQSLLNSTVSLSDLGNTGLVPVTSAENIVSNTFAQAK